MARLARISAAARRGPWRRRHARRGAGRTTCLAWAVCGPTSWAGAMPAQTLWAARVVACPAPCLPQSGKEQIGRMFG
eukprot:XP_001692577.1 predicted protein [Chlamydomonas reinhardtii]